MANWLAGWGGGLHLAQLVGSLLIATGAARAERSPSEWVVGVESRMLDVPVGTAVGEPGSEPGDRWNSMDANAFAGTVRHLSASAPFGLEFAIGGGPRVHRVFDVFFLDLPEIHEPLANEGSVLFLQSKVLWDPLRWNQVAPFLRAGASVVHGEEHLEYGSFRIDGTPIRRTSTLDREWTSLDADLDLMVRVFWLEAGLSWGFPLVHQVDWRQEVIEPEDPPSVRAVSVGAARFGFGFGLQVPLSGLESVAWRSTRDSAGMRHRSRPKRNELTIAAGGGPFDLPWSWKKSDLDSRAWEIEAMLLRDFEGTGTWGGYAGAGLGVADGTFGSRGWSRSARAGVWRRILQDQDFPAKLMCGIGVVHQEVRYEGTSTRTYHEYAWNAEAWIVRTTFDVLIERGSWFVGVGALGDVFARSAHDPMNGGDTGPLSLEENPKVSFGIDWRLGWKTSF